MKFQEFMLKRCKAIKDQKRNDASRAYSEVEEAKVKLVMADEQFSIACKDYNEAAKKLKEKRENIKQV